jgi:hypothetical protein
MAMGPTLKCHFVLGLSIWSPEFFETGTIATLEAHNLLCRPMIKVRSQEKFKPLSKKFQQYVARHLLITKSKQFPIFSGRESNWQFDSGPFFWQ